MLKRSRRNKSPNGVSQRAAAVVTLATGQPVPPKNPAAVALGRLGGLKGGKARKDALSEERRREIASKAARARWSKKKAKEEG
jgi:hypothetical protein